MSGCLEASWKRPNTGERVSGFGDREELEFAKPAEGTNMIIILQRAQNRIEAHKFQRANASGS